MFISNPRPKLLVLCGLPGSGKSSVKLEEENQNTFWYSTDDYIEDYAAQNNKTYSECFVEQYKNAEKAMNESLQQAILNGDDVVWDQTNLTTKKRKAIVEKFPTAYEAFCLYVLPPRCEADKALLKRRLASREGKDIPAHVIESMTKSFQEPQPNEGFEQVIKMSMFQNVMERRSW